MNPILVEVTRGDLVESRHRGAIAIADAAGRIAWSCGDIERPIYPRSAVKMLQALTLVDPAPPTPSGSATKSWPWPAPRTAASRSTSRPCARGWPHRTGRRRPGLRRADLRGWPAADPRPPQLFGQAHRLPHRRPPPRGRDPRLSAAGPPGAAPGAGDDGRDGRRRRGHMPSPSTAAPRRPWPCRSRLATAIARIADPSGLPPDRAAAARRLDAAVKAEPSMSPARAAPAPP